MNYQARFPLQRSQKFKSAISRHHMRPVPGLGGNDGRRPSIMWKPGRNPPTTKDGQRILDAIQKWQIGSGQQPWSTPGGRPPKYDPDPRWLYGWEAPADTGDIHADYASLTDEQRDAYGVWRESDAYEPGWGNFIKQLKNQHMKEQGWFDDSPVLKHASYGNRGPDSFRPATRTSPPTWMPGHMRGVPSNQTPGTPYNPGQVPQMHAKQPSQMHQYRQQWKSPAPYNPTQAKRPSSNWY